MSGFPLSSPPSKLDSPTYLCLSFFSTLSSQENYAFQIPSQPSPPSKLKIPIPTSPSTQPPFSPTISSTFIQFHNLLQSVKLSTNPIPSHNLIFTPTSTTQLVSPLNRASVDTSRSLVTPAQTLYQLNPLPQLNTIQSEVSETSLPVFTNTILTYIPQEQYCPISPHNPGTHFFS